MPYAENEEFLVYRVGPDDFEIFAEAQSLRLLDVNPADENELKEFLAFDKAISQEGPAYWSCRFEETILMKKSAAFILIEKKSGIVSGAADIIYKYDAKGVFYAEFQAGHINANHRNSELHENLRGKKLSELLYQARISFALQETVCKKARCFISSDNISSWRAAEKAGFYLDCEERVPGNPDLFVRCYELDLESLRMKKVNTLEVRSLAL
ncbi:MAG: hypothetical protein ACT4OY_07595 [Alphaproteobacteria bacterium]